jgi:hypothetical protein
VEGGDGVDQLRPAPLPLEALQEDGQGGRVHPLVVDGHLVQIGLGVAEGLQGADEGRRFDDHRVPGIDQQVGDQVDALRAADGDQQVVRGDADPLGAELGDEQLDEGRGAGDRAVLEGVPAAALQHPAGGLHQLVDGERAGVGEAVGEGDDARRRGRAGAEERRRGAGGAPGEQGLEVGHRQTSGG